MENCSELFCNISLHRIAWLPFWCRQFEFFMTLGGVTSFSRIKTYEIHVNASITVKFHGGISFHVMAEAGQYPTDTLAFSSCLVW